MTNPDSSRSDKETGQDLPVGSDISTRASRLRRRLSIVALSLFLLILFSWLLSGFVLRGLGAWLTHEDPLEKADAIVAHGGHFPYRAIEAAELFSEGWAPEIWLVHRPAGNTQIFLDSLGLHFPDEVTRNELLLARLGVPPSAILVIKPGARNTAEEIQSVSGQLAGRNLDRVILVTSRAHTRRVRSTWKRLAGDRGSAIVRNARTDEFAVDSWWKSTSNALAVVREVLGLMNLWAGFPLSPQET